MLQVRRTYLLLLLSALSWVIFNDLPQTIYVPRQLSNIWKKIDREGSPEASLYSTKKTTEKLSMNLSQIRPNIVSNIYRYLVQYKKYCVENFKVGSKSTLPCPCLPKELGKMPPVEGDIMSPRKISDVEALHQELLPGGAWKPTNCSARQRVAIIIPYRDRAAHLSIFLRHMHPFLQRQQLEYRIFVIEQIAPKIFNRAALQNVGFVEALKMSEFDCAVLHDVDLLPEDDRNMYTCRHDLVTHLTIYLDRAKYKSVPWAYGGGMAVTPGLFKKINGFSNNFWGWGGEDTDMNNRIKAAHYEYGQPSAPVSRYKSINHDRDKGNPKNPQRQGTKHLFFNQYHPIF